MTDQTTPPPAPVPATAPRSAIPSWLVLGIGVLALLVATAALTATVVGHGLLGQIASSVPWAGSGYGPGMMGGYGASGNGYGPGMMGGYGDNGAGYGPGMMGGYGGPATGTGTQPGDPGFVAGTPASPRVIDVLAGPGYTFSPSTIVVQRGETISFRVTAMGPLVHEFMVGPAAAVAADQEGTPEIADIAMMQTKTLTYTFDGDGPYAFACHADDHYQNGMKGTISVVG